MINEWRFSGELVKITEVDSIDIGATLVVRGISQRKDNISSHIVEMIVSIPVKLWEEACDNGVRPYSIVELAGHFETHIRASEINIKTSMRYFVDEFKIIKR